MQKGPHRVNTAKLAQRMEGGQSKNEKEVAQSGGGGTFHGSPGIRRYISISEQTQLQMVQLGAYPYLGRG